MVAVIVAVHLAVLSLILGPRCVAYILAAYLSAVAVWGGVLVSKGKGALRVSVGVALSVAAQQAAYEIWKADFVGVGKMRGVGWAICYQNPANGKLSNHWISLHETGNVAGFDPILVMDVWEHAFILDYKPADRPKYIEAFFSNIDWNTVERRSK